MFALEAGFHATQEFLPLEVIKCVTRFVLTWLIHALICMKIRPGWKRVVSYFAILFKRANGWLAGASFPANMLANASSSSFPDVLSLFFTITSLSPKFIDVWPISAAAMALVPPDVDASNGTSISFVRWPTRNARHHFPTSSASNSTFVTIKMRTHNQVAPHAVRTALDLHIYIHTCLRFRLSAVVLKVLNDLGVVENECCCISSVILNRCSKWRHRGRLYCCTNDGFESCGQQPPGIWSCFCCDEPTLYFRVNLQIFDHMMSRSQLTFVQKYIIIYIQQP